MYPLAVSLVTFIAILGCALVGALLPGHRLSGDSKDFVRLGAGVIGTIAALVLGLLIAAANTSYDTQRNQVRRIAAGVIQLDNSLAQYGPEARRSRELLRDGLRRLVDRVWTQSAGTTAGSAPFRATPASEEAYLEILGLTPHNDIQTQLKAMAVQTLNELVQTRLLLFEQTDSAIPTPFLGILIIWLAVIFGSFSLFARFDLTVIVSSVVFALSASCALFLILEMNRPFVGLMQISSATLVNALPPLTP